MEILKIVRKSSLTFKEFYEENNFIYKELKGEGYFCEIHKFTHKINKKSIAVKILKKKYEENKDYINRLNREIELLKTLKDCTEIIDLIDNGDKPRIWYSMPFANYNLDSYMHTDNKKNEEKFYIINQIISAIDYAHNRKILHRDISPNNILIFESNNGPLIKVSDFGLGKDLTALSHYTASSKVGYGQSLYISPEQEEGLKKATEKSDIYSLGKLIYFIWTGKKPKDLTMCELSSLIEKACGYNPDNRFANINELKIQYEILKNLILFQNKKMSLKEYLADNKDDIDWLKFEQFALNPDYSGQHVFDAYLWPVTKILLKDDNLKYFYAVIGNSIKLFLEVYIKELSKCLATTGWSYKGMDDFGIFFYRIFNLVNDDTVKFICLKELWLLAFDRTQYSVQKLVVNIINRQVIPKSIEIQFAEYILSSNISPDRNDCYLPVFNSINYMPTVIKSVILQVQEKKQYRKRI